MTSDNALSPPSNDQLSFAKLLGMSRRALRHQSTASALQFCTVGATAAFLAFVLSEMAVMRAAKSLPTAPPDPEARMAQLIWILVISLLVCAISNVTSMLLSVTKRFREIGTMKCLGAFDGTILWLFLMEAMMLGGAGAVAGAALGALGSLSFAMLRHGTAVLSWGLMSHFAGAMCLTAIVVSILTLMGAAYPAWQASRKLPIDAMRST